MEPPCLRHIWSPPATATGKIRPRPRGRQPAGTRILEQSPQTTAMRGPSVAWVANARQAKGSSGAVRFSVKRRGFAVEFRPVSSDSVDRARVAAFGIAGLRAVLAVLVAGSALAAGQYRRRQVAGADVRRHLLQLPPPSLRAQARRERELPAPALHAGRPGGRGHGELSGGHPRRSARRQGKGQGAHQAARRKIRPPERAARRRPQERPQGAAGGAQGQAARARQVGASGGERRRKPAWRRRPSPSSSRSRSRRFPYLVVLGGLFGLVGGAERLGRFRLEEALGIRERLGRGLLLLGAGDGDVLAAGQAGRPRRHCGRPQP